MKSLSERMIVVRLGLHQWYPRKYDKKASRDLADSMGASASEEVVRVNKLLVNLGTIKPLQHEFSMLRRRHYSMTAPWKDTGDRLLPVELYMNYTQMVSEFNQRIDRLADRFAFDDYERELKGAQSRLGGLFNETDFPPAEDVRARFGVSVHFEPVADPGDARLLNADDDVRASIEASAHEQTIGALRQAQEAIVEQLMTVAHEFIDKIKKYDTGETRRLYTTSLENLRDVVNLVLGGLNITEDPELHDMATRLAKVIDGLVIDQLKHSESTRLERTQQVQEIVDKFGGVFGGWEL